MFGKRLVRYSEKNRVSCTSALFSAYASGIRLLSKKVSADNHSLSRDEFSGVYSYFPKGILSSYSELPLLTSNFALSNSPIRSNSSEEKPSKSRFEEQNFSAEPFFPLPSGSSIGAFVSKFCISPVFESYGNLWQWRSVALYHPYADESKRSSKAENICQNPILFCMVPFLLLPGRIVHTMNPILSEDAIHKIGSMVNTQRSKDGFGYIPFHSVTVQIPSAIGTLNPTVTQPSLAGEDGKARGSVDRGFWASSYFDLLDHFEAWEFETTPKPSCSFQDALRRNGWAAEVRVPSKGSTLSLETRRTLNESLFSLPQRRATESSRVFAERCWGHFVQSRTKSSNPDSNLQSCLNSEEQKNGGNNGSFSLLERRTIPPQFRNVIGGGLAEIIISLDRYAALIARDELSVAAASWALLRDTSNVEVVQYLRFHAVELEREVIAATTAHKLMTSKVQHKNLALQRESCSNAVAVHDYPSTPS